jgi:hypothetical protein
LEGRRSNESRRAHHERHLGDDAHVMVAEEVYRGERKKLKTSFADR